jgi:beta-alanine degradation protein BauB
LISLDWEVDGVSLLKLDVKCYETVYLCSNEDEKMSIRMESTEDRSVSGRAQANLLFEDGKTKITAWTFAPGDETGWHHHNFDYVTIQKSGGRLKLESQDGAIKYVDYRKNSAAAYSAPIKHNATNISGEEVRVIEIEYKR